MNKHRIQRSATIRLDGPIETVFPLFGPIREKDWAEGWDPRIIIPTGVLVEKHMVFQTSHGNEVFTWIIVNYEPGKFFIEYLVTATERLWTITVQCTPNDAQTFAMITYSYTGLTEVGIHNNEAAIKKMFSHDLKDWEQAINDYLQ